MIQFGMLRFALKTTNGSALSIALTMLGWVVLWMVSAGWGTVGAPTYTILEACTMGDSVDLFVAVLFVQPVCMIINVFFLFILAYLVNEVYKIKYLWN
jgi:hypothetical protein